jgi:hypothetical protein
MPFSEFKVMQMPDRPKRPEELNMITVVEHRAGQAPTVSLNVDHKTRLYVQRLHFRMLYHALKALGQPVWDGKLTRKGIDDFNLFVTNGMRQAVLSSMERRWPGHAIGNRYHFILTGAEGRAWTTHAERLEDAEFWLTFLDPAKNPVP